MKIRNGFVSNSSSSSFIVFGIRTTDDNIKFDKEVYESADDFLDSCGLFHFRDSEENYIHVGEGECNEPGINSFDIPHGGKMKELLNMLNSISNKKIKKEDIKVYFGEVSDR